MQATGQNRIEAGLQEALAAANGDPGLASLATVLADTLAALSRPMRVAVVGLIKAGKSTLLNALLGEPLLPTGTAETTFTVGALEWSEQPTLLIRYKDDRPPERRPFDDLARLVRRGEDLDLLRSIARVEIGYPNPLLRQMTLVDTPGLGSTHQHDSENTRAFLKLRGAESIAASEHEAAGADAVMYVFSRSLHESDQAVLGELQGAALGRASPLNSVGVLSKVDLYWPDETPLGGGTKVARRLLDDPRMNRLLYGVVPIAGLAAGGAQGLTSDEQAALQHLAALPEASLRRLLANDERFATSNDTACPVKASLRAQLLDRLGAWGVWTACECLRNDTDQPLCSALAERTGLEALRTLILRHFGNRARLIKLNAAMPRLRTALFAARRELGQTSARRALETIGTILERLERHDPALGQLAVLQDLYAGRLDLDTEERTQIQAVTGENGETLAARLGVRETSSPSDLRKIAEDRIEYWHALAAGTGGRPYATTEAARVVARGFEHIALQLSGCGSP